MVKLYTSTGELLFVNPENYKELRAIGFDICDIVNYVCGDSAGPPNFSEDYDLVCKYEYESGQCSNFTFLGPKYDQAARDYLTMKALASI